ncbi:hypothetical protein ISP04_09900 [Staphylococcus kloosii]|jgi:hypothetical protein|nr:hypothetical protein [Staphylococcus kloosii]
MTKKNLKKSLFLIVGLLFMLGGLIFKDNALYYPIGICFVCLAFVNE